MVTEASQCWRPGQRHPFPARFLTTRYRVPHLGPRESEPRTMELIKVFNPGPSEKVSDSLGRIIDAHGWAEVDPSDSTTQRLLQTGGLIIPAPRPARSKVAEAPAEDAPAEDAPAAPATKRSSKQTPAKNGDN